jgi:uncharacterized membrane protein
MKFCFAKSQASKTKLFDTTLLYKFNIKTLKMHKKLILAVFLLLIIDIAAAAVIHGTVYNLDLEKQPNTVITVNSTPKQTLVSKDSSYTFQLPAGSYAIKAEYNEDTTTEAITIKEEGTYVLDLILFPSFLEEDLLEEEIEEPVLEDEYFKTPVPAVYYITLVIAIVIIAIAIYLIIRYKKLAKKLPKEEKLEGEADELDKIYEFIKKNKRVLQKQIRKKFPSSEAKISLILKELEHKGKIEKIKKGRGNLIILKK